MKAGERIPAAVLERTVTGVNLAPGGLREQLGEGMTLLVFLRHFGCIFCRETLADLRACAEKDADFPGVLFVFEGAALEGKAFVRRYWPRARAIADPSATLYDDFGVGRGGLVEMFRPAVWKAQDRARDKGHANGPRSGDIWRMPGAFLVQGDRVLWAHEYRHAADHPDYGHIRDVACDAAGCGEAR